MSPDTGLLAAARKNGNGNEALTVAKVEEKFAADDAQSVGAWLEAMGTQDLSIRILRKEPRVYKGVSIAGSLGVFTEMLDEEEMKERWGGGTFAISVQKRGKNGQMQFAGGRTIRIAGPPRMDDYEVAATPGVIQAGPDLGSQALSSMQRQLEREQDRRDRDQRSGGFDPMLLSAITAPMTAQIEAANRSTLALQQTIADKDARMMEIVSRKPDDGFKDTLLSKMFDSESSRIEHLRTSHESEMRQLREGARQDIERERTRLADELKSLEKRHDRELDMMKKAQDQAVDAKKVAFDTRIDGLQAEIKRLERDLIKLEKENGELRAKKEKSFVESAKEIVSLQETLKGIGIGGKDDDENDDADAPWWQKGARAIMENPEAIGQFIGGVRANAVGQPATQQQMAMAQMATVPRRRKKLRPRSGGIEQPGQVPQMANRALEPTARSAAPVIPAQDPLRAAPGPNTGQTPPASAPDIRPPDPQEMTLAITFMEGALEAGTEAAAFAQTAAGVIPSGILNYIARVGVDEFLMNSVELSPESPLRGQRGRNFVRNVWRHLIAAVPSS